MSDVDKEDLNEDPFDSLESSENSVTGNSVEEELTRDVPEKYRNKSIEDLVEMHRNLESTLGRQSNELGELRKQHQEMLELTRRQSSQETPMDTSDNDLDWYSNPSEAAEKIVNKRVSALEQQLLEDRADRAAAALRAKIPDVETIIAGEDFRTFINTNPVRSKLIQQARESMDTSIIEYLVNEFKTTSKVSNSNRNDPNRGIGEMGSSNTSSKAQPKLRRSQIQHLRATNPKRYESLQAQIRRAYEENRVILD